MATGIEQFLLGSNDHTHAISWVFGIVTAFFAHTAALIYRVQVAKAPSFSESIPSLCSTVMCYGLSIFATSCFLGIHFDLEFPNRAFSLAGVFLAFLVTGLSLGSAILFLYALRANSTWLRLVYVFYGGFAVVASHLSFIVFPQFNLVFHIDLLNLFGVYLMTAGWLWFLARFFLKTLYSDTIDPKVRMRYAGSLASLNVLTVFGLKIAIDFKPMATAMPAIYLPLDPGHYLWIVTVASLMLILFVIYGLYDRMYAQITELLQTSERLEDENQEYLDEVHQANIQAELNVVKIRALEEAINSNESKVDIPIDSMVSAVLTLEDGIFDWDLGQDRLSISDAWRNLLGFSEEEEAWVDLERWRSGFLSSDLVDLDEAIESLISGDEKVAKFQMRYQPPEGGILKIEFKLAAVRNAYGLVSKFVGLMEDRTAEMLVEMDVRDNLSEESKLSSRKSEFVTYLSHQIRTPMTVISSANALLEAGLRYDTLNEERIFSHIDQLDYALSLLRSLVDETLIFIGSETALADLHQEDLIDVNSLLNEVLRVETKRRSQSLPDGFEIKRQIPSDYQVVSSEMLLAHIFRQFISFVFDNPQDARGMFVYSEKNKLYLQVLYVGIPEWVKVQEPVNEHPESLFEAGAQILPIDEDKLPFALLLSKRVIRNLRGRLILRRVAEQLSMTVEMPLVRGE